MKGLNRCDVPPPPGPRYPIRRLKAGESKLFVLLGPLSGCYTHYNGKSTEPCWGEKRDCPGHKRGMPLRWKGYVHVWNQSDNVEEFLELTPTAAQQVNDCVGTLGAKMRGNRLQVARGRGDKARLRVELQAHVDNFSSFPELPPPKTPWETLSRLWNVNFDDGPPDVLPIPA